MHSNVMFPFMVQALQDPPLCSSTLERVAVMQKDNLFSASNANAMKLYASNRLTGITSAPHS
jgi:hypothetical protein